MDLNDRIFELFQSGYYCAGILAKLLTETVGEENEALVRAISGLDGGIGHSNDVCGCMAAGCCILAYFGEDSKGLQGEFVNWFKDEMLTFYGGYRCDEIIKGDPAKRVEICPGIIADVYSKCMELLESKGLI